MKTISKILVCLLCFLLIGQLTFCQNSIDTIIRPCTIVSYTIKFSSVSKSLPDTAKPHLKLVAKMMKENTNCKLLIGSCCGGGKQANQLAWDRVNALIRYLIEKEGLTEDQFAFGYDLTDEMDTIALEGESILGRWRVPGQ